MIAMIPAINLIVTGGTDKTMFFFKFVTTEKGIDMNPIRCIKLDEVAINFEWVSYGVSISCFLSGEFSVRQAQREVVEIKNLDFLYWA